MDNTILMKGTDRRLVMGEVSKQLMNNIVQDYLNSLSGDVDEELAAKIHDFKKENNIAEIVLAGKASDVKDSDLKQIIPEENLGMRGCNHRNIWTANNVYSEERYLTEHYFVRMDYFMHAHESVNYAPFIIIYKEKI